MRLRLKIILLMFFIFFSVIPPSFSQPGGMRLRPGKGAWHEESLCWKALDLNLSQDQMKDHDLIQQGYLRETQLLRAQLLLKRLELREFLTNSNVKIEAIRSKYAEINQLQSRLEEKVIEYLVKVRNILAPEQLKNWCPELEFPSIRGIPHGPGPMGPMGPRKFQPPGKSRED
jgi:Spy/CpxP family protein refolding chaperone